MGKGALRWLLPSGLLLGACLLVVFMMQMDKRDGGAFIGSSSKGELYRYTPGDDRLESLGRAIQGETANQQNVSAGCDGQKQL